MNEPQPNNLAIGYARRSTLSQRDNTSLNDQMQRIQQYAEREGLELHHLAFDDGVSGASMNRPGLWDAIWMLKCIECQPSVMPNKLTSEAWLENCSCEAMNGADTLVIWDFKRFGRNSRETIFLCLDVLDQFDKRLIIVDGAMKLDTATPQGRFMLQLLALLAELDREEISEKMNRGKDHIKLHSNKYAGGGIPYGFRSDKQCKSGSNLVPKVDPNDPTKGEYANLKHILLLSELGFSQRRIAQEMNELKRHPRSGGLWHKTHIHRVLNETDDMHPQFREQMEQLRAEIKWVAEKQKVKVQI